jgi:uncharacterized protein (DUF1499 family)
MIVAGKGELHAVHETSFLRFQDDVKVKVAETREGTRMECWSSSRLGIYDFGQNARNLRQLLHAVERELG